MQVAVHPGEAYERRVPLTHGTTVGRAEECEVRVLHASLSRKHAIFEVVGRDVFVRDLGSKNGTWVNGRRVDHARVGPGDGIRVGEVPLALVDPLGEATLVPALVHTVAPARTVTLLRAGAARMTDRTDRLGSLLEVSQLLGRPMALDALLQEVLDLTCRVFAVERAAVLLADGDGALRTRVSRPPGPDRHSNTIAAWVFRNRQAALFADAAADPRSAAAASVHELAIRSCMAAPLVPHDRAVGVLYLDDRDPDRFGQADLAYLGAFANQVAIAIDNAHLRRELEAEVAARSTLQRFFPPTALPSLLASGGRIDPIEVEVTALFCDLVDYTRLAGSLPPREVIPLLNRYFEAVSAVVFECGGTLEKYVGDAVLAVWGAPVACEDHADKALRAAGALHAAIARAGDPRIRIHVGLHTGRVAAGNIGTATYLQYATIGDATNVASRVASLAGGGEVVFSEATWRRLSRKPEGARREEAVLKGKDGAFALYRWGVG